MKNTLKMLALFMVLPGFMFSQSKWRPQNVKIGLGLRGTYNFFPGKDTFRGFGTGGQFKINAGKKVNTEFFLDYISSDDRRSGSRNDYHFGWSVQFSPFGNFGEGKVRAYFLGGQCFDFTKVSVRPSATTGGGFYTAQETPYVFSAAIQGGAGLSTFIRNDFELTLQFQYMMHLGRDVHIDYPSEGSPVLENEKHTSPAGHMILSFSVNYYLLRLWKK